MYTLQSYLSQIQSSLASGHATEHTYRPALKELFETITGFTVHNEPKRSEHGAPDFIFLDGMIPMMYAEAKDIHISLDKIEKSEQLARYFGYPKLILTNGIEFRFYNNGIRYGEPIIIARKEGNMLDIAPEKFSILENEMRAFMTDYIDTIRSAGHLAKIMGGKAQRIRDNLREMMGNTEKYPDIWKLYHTFKSEILHDLTTHDFADLYAQTLVYGLFVARYHDQTPEDFTRSEARDLVPKSNPLLRRFFDHIAGEGYEKRLEYIVDELCRVFAHAEVKKLMHGVYQKETHDPVIHFYEDFLSEYDSDLRMQRGVFYTPAPVVKFIVRAIDDVLKTHFHLPKGLADTSKIQIERDIQKYDKKGERKTEMIETHRVQILDPATGTGTFLDEIVRYIYAKMSGQTGMWSSYVNQDLLPRLHGFELMMASYTIAHLKLGLTLAETGVTDIEKRLQIYLTNSLEEAKVKKEDQGTLFGLLESITDEAKQADEVKRDKPVMIVVGNPPYSGISTNVGEWITKKIEDYKYVDGVHFGEKKHWLQDDYVKFFRLGESLIEKNGEGILAYITNHGYLDNPTFRGMRWHLLKTFDHIYIVDLHGNSKKKETTPDGGKDENVFDIQQGTAIFIGVKSGKKKPGALANITHIDQYGKRQEKYDWLENNTLESAIEITPENPYYFFVPKNTDGQEEYEKGFSIGDIFPLNVTGIVTAIDKLAIHYSPEEAKEFTSRILNSINPYQEFDIKDQRKHKKEARITELKEAFENLPTKIAYRPFDIRYMYYTKKTECWINSPRYENMKHMFHDKNLCLLLPKAFCDKEFAHVFISNSITEAIFLSGTTGSNAMCSPLYLYSDSETLDGTTKTPNLDATIWMKISGSVGRETTPEEVLDYIYAVLHSPKYREKYREFLKIDFPRVPYPTSRESFEALVKLGGELRGLHLLESPKVQEYITTFPIAGSGEVEKVTVQDSPLEGSPKAGVDISDDPSWAKNSLFLYWSLPKNKELIDRAKVLRKQGILSEVLFWQAFKDRERLGWDIDRQVIIGNYIVDFFIAELGLVFEIDGSSHEGKEDYDSERETFLMSHGLKVIHIGDLDVKNNLEGVGLMVEESIARRIKELETATPPPLVGTPQGGESPKKLLNISINSTQYFGNVPEVAWDFYIGGYQPAQKWLKDRKRRVLTWEDIAHYQSMIVALTETVRVMGEIDRVLVL